MDYNLTFGYRLKPRTIIPEITNLKYRFYHTYIIGKPGMGKSVLMERMAFYDISMGLSTIFIDPKGDSVRRLYHLVEDKKKIKYISIKKPIVINPLKKDGYDLDDLIAEFVQILDILITLTASNPESTVLMREIIGMAFRVLPDDKKNLSDLVDFLLYKSKRDEIRAKLKDPKLLTYWREFDDTEFNRYPKNKDKIESAKRVASRLLEISTGKMKDMVEGDNELYIDRLVNNGEILLVDTSRMSQNSRIYLTNLIIYSVMSYCEYYQGKTNPLICYVDEFQTVVSPLFTDILARSRSKKVGFVLAHQSLLQLPKKELSNILNMSHTVMAFRTGKSDADEICDIFDVKAKDIFNLKEYYAYIRIGTDSTLLETFSPLLEEVPAPPEGEVKDNKLSADEMIAHFFLSDDWIVV